MIGKPSEACRASKIPVFDGVECPSIQKQLLTKRELATVLGVSERTIENWLAEKRIPRLRLSARLQ